MSIQQGNRPGGGVSTYGLVSTGVSSVIGAEAAPDTGAVFKVGLILLDGGVSESRAFGGDGLSVSTI